MSPEAAFHFNENIFHKTCGIDAIVMEAVVPGELGQSKGIKCFTHGYIMVPMDDYRKAAWLPVYHLHLLPAAASPAQGIADSPDYKVTSHGKPHAYRAYPKGKGQKISGANPYQPHGDGSYDHHKAGIACGPEGAGDDKRHGPQQAQGDTVHCKKDIGGSPGFRTKVEKACQVVSENKVEAAHDKKRNPGDF